jgi:hypothetical protein
LNPGGWDEESIQYGEPNKHDDPKARERRFGKEI